MTERNTWLTTPWNDAAVKRLRELWPAMGHTAVARVLTAEFKRKFTRSAVAGKGDRIGLPAKTREMPKPASSRPNIRSISSTALRASEKAIAPIRVSQGSHPTTYDPARIGMTLDEAQEVNGCRWPVTHGRPHRFCGERADGPYCTEHAARAYRIAEAAE